MYNINLLKSLKDWHDLEAVRNKGGCYNSALNLDRINLRGGKGVWGRIKDNDNVL